jgi:hypothetical protein
MKYLQEVTDWGIEGAQNHTYYVSDDKTKMVGYIKQGTVDLFKFKHPIAIYTKGRKFVELKKKGEPDSVYFTKQETFVPKAAIIVKGSNGKEYSITKIGSKYTCTCPGFSFRGKCKHVDNLK